MVSFYKILDRGSFRNCDGMLLTPVGQVEPKL